MVSRSVAPLFAEAARRINSGQSMRSLLSDEPTYG
jgi:ribose-phosphate pyrophosphokinase